MPATVYDRATSEPVTGSPEELAAGIASGKYAFDDAAQVPVKNDDGIVQLPANEAAAKLASGDYSLPTLEEEEREKVAAEESKKGLGESIGQGVQSAVNQALLGVPEAVTSHTETPEEAAHREAVEQYHHVARTIGGIGGFGASMLAGGEVFKGIEMAGKAAAGLALPAEEAAAAGLTRKLVAKGIELGTQGAALAAPQALVHAAFGDPKQAAETLAWGAGLGAVLGVPGELLGAAGSAIGKLTKPGGFIADKLEQVADEYTPKAMGAQKSQIRKIPEVGVGNRWGRDDLIKFAHDEGLISPGMNKSDIGIAVDNAYRERSDGVGDVIEALDKTREVSDPDQRRAILDAHLTPGKIADAVSGAFDMSSLQGKAFAPIRSAVEDVVDTAMNLKTVNIGGREVVPFEVAQNFKRALRADFNGAVNKVQSGGGLSGQRVITPLDQAKANAYEAVGGAILKAGDDVATASGQPELVSKLGQHNRDLSMLHTLKEWTGNAQAQQLGNKGVGLTDWLAAHAAGAAGGTIGAVFGGPAGAAVGHAAGFGASFLVKHWAEDKGLVYLSTAAKRAAASGDSDLFAAVLGADARARLSATMTGVQDTVKRMALMGIQATAARKNEHLKALLGDTTGLSSSQQLTKLQDRVATLASNPAALASATSAVVGPLAVAAPEIADGMQRQLAGQVQYLAQATPRAPGPPAPFAPSTWSPSDAQQLAFHDKAEIVASPMAAMKHVAQGTLSDAHLDALKTNYPVIYDMMRGEVLKYAATHPSVKLPVPERASIAKFLGVPLDAMDSPASIAALQQTYAGQPVDGSAPQNPKMSGTKLKNAPSHSTTYGATLGPNEKPGS